ncbi:MAG: PAS domain-containing protein [Proteobacteria bacterium]|nr:PAS domain-containing protein [Pseudomonadota bacterium]
MISRTQSALFPAIGPTLSAKPDRVKQLRRLTSVMLLRVVLYTLLLGGTVVVHVVWGAAEELAGAYVAALFVFITSIYVLSIFYALWLRRTRDLRHMAIAQIVVDLLASAVLVHCTGSAESAFVLFFLLSPIAAALTLRRRGALITALAGSALLIATVLLGYWRWLPVLPGLSSYPWQLPATTVARRLAISCSAMLAIAALAEHLAEQLRQAATQVEAQQAQIADLAAIYGDVVRCLTSGLLTVDKGGQVLTSNDAACELLQRSEGALLNQPLSALAPELATLLRNGQPVQRAEVTLRPGAKGQPLVLGVSVSTLADRHEQVIGHILNFQDLTRLRQMEQTMRRSEHFAALGRVAAGVAHEIRNPLASISGALQLLRGERALEGENRALMDIALREIERLNGLVCELLDYTRPREAPVFEPVELGAEVEQYAAQLRGLLVAEDAPGVVVETSDCALWVRGDRDRLRGVLWNLVQNAWQAGEHATVTVGVRPLGDEQVLVEVRDRGRGIAAEHRERLFEPFFTTRAEGTGLGLAIVHRAVQDHGGSIEVVSEAGHGTTFSITLPRVPAPSAAA